MQPPLSRRSIPPKVSTVPRPKTEASAYLDLYQLAVEKKRLQQELQMLEVRKQQLQQRLTTIDQKMGQLNEQASSLTEGLEVTHLPASDSAVPETPQSPSFDTFLLEY